MTGIVLYECLTHSSSGHHVEKAEIWVNEAAEFFDEVTLVTFAMPIFAVPENVRVISCGPLPAWCHSPVTTRFRGLRQAWLNFGGWRRALHHARLRRAAALSLTTLAPGILLASLFIRRKLPVGHLVMAIPGEATGQRPSSRCLRLMIRVLAKRGFSFFCNTDIIASIFRKRVAPHGRSVFVTRDPVQLPPTPDLRPLTSQGSFRMLIPGDDRAERSGIATIAKSPALPARTHLLIHVPGASPARVAEIRATLEASHALLEFSIEDRYLSRHQLYALYHSADAVLLAYQARLQMGSGNLLIALACKRPVLASGFQAFTEMERQVGKLGESFIADQPKTLIAAIQHLRSWGTTEWTEFDLHCDVARSLFCSRSIATTTFKHLLAISETDTAIPT